MSHGCCLFVCLFVCFFVHRNFTFLMQQHRYTQNQNLWDVLSNISFITIAKSMLIFGPIYRHRTGFGLSVTTITNGIVPSERSTSNTSDSMNECIIVCIFIYRTYHISHVSWQFTILLSEIKRQLKKAPLVAAMSSNLISLAHPTHACNTSHCQELVLSLPR